VLPIDDGVDLVAAALEPDEDADRAELVGDGATGNTGE